MEQIRMGTCQHCHLTHLFYVDGACGIKIPIVSPDQITFLRNALPSPCLRESCEALRWAERRLRKCVQKHVAPIHIVLQEIAHVDPGLIPHLTFRANRASVSTVSTVQGTLTRRRDLQDYHERLLPQDQARRWDNKVAC